MCCPPYLPPPTLTCHHPPSLCPPLSPFTHLPPSCPSACPLRPPALFVAWPSTCDHCRGPCLHAHLPLPALPSHLAHVTASAALPSRACHSHDMVVTDHPRCTIVTEAAPHQPPVMHPCTGTHLSRSILDPTLSPSRTRFQFHLPLALSTPFSMPHSSFTTESQASTSTSTSKTTKQLDACTRARTRQGAGGTMA